MSFKIIIIVYEYILFIYNNAPTRTTKKPK